MKNRPYSLLAGLFDLGRRLRLEPWTTVALVVAFLAALAIALTTTELRSLALRAAAASWSAGSSAPRDFVVEKDATYVDEAATQARRDAQAALVPPVYTISATVTASALASFDRFSQAVLRETRRGASMDHMLLTLQVEFPNRFTRDDLRVLLGAGDLPAALAAGRDILDGTLSRGIVDLGPRRAEAADAGSIEVRRTDSDRVHSEIISLDQVTTLDDVSDQTDARLRDGPMPAPERLAVQFFIRSFGVENAFYDPDTTLMHRNRARAAVEPVEEKLTRGHVLVRRGDLISEATAARIRALGESSRYSDVNTIAGSVLYLLLVFALGAYLLRSRSVQVQVRLGQIVLVLSMGLVSLGLSALIVRFVPLPGWIPITVVFPSSSLAMLVAIIVSTPVAVTFSIVSSLSLLLLPGMELQGFLFALLSGIAGTAVVMDAERRIDLVKAGLLLSLIDAFILLTLGLEANVEPRRMGGLLGLGLVNGFFCGSLTLGFLPILELALNAPTRFKLMELSDLNAPIFKRMLSQAPGTYTHSISVANLAESACETIGANALLARVSAYYHDIGKVDQADYFVENQKAFNRHDGLRPSLSAAVIKSHVRIGIEKAQELKLPQAIIDIIAQHHGRGLITFFYHRAMKEGKNSRVSRDDYSYPGVRPKTKEAAVLMLADTVEAASRSLKRPTEARLEQFVQEMIMEKLSSGELGDSNLTLRDLDLIRRSFVHILEGYFHTRIEYPKIARARGGRS